MIKIEISDKAAVLLMDILAESQFPLMSSQTNLAVKLYCTIDKALEEAKEAKVAQAERLKEFCKTILSL